MFRPFTVVTLGLGLAAMACAQAGPAGTGTVQTGTDQPRSGGRLNLRLSGDFTSFDTTLGAGRDPVIARHVRNRLLGYKTGPDVKYEDAVLGPELAERWEVSPDARTYTFHLRKGVKWHDLPPVNGRELTSADVKTSFDYWGRTGQFADKKMKASRVTDPIEGLEKITTPDPYTVVLSYRAPFVPLAHHMASAPSVIMPAELLEAEGGHPTHSVIGTGAYYLDEAAGQKGTRYVWRKHPGYFQAGKPYLDEFYQLLIPNEAAARAAFQVGQIDLFTEDITIQTGEEFAKANPNAVRYEYPMTRTGTLIFNERPGYLFADGRLRKAFSLALDRDEFIRTFSKGQGQWALTHSQPGMFTQEETKRILRHDPTEAARLVKEAGYANGVDIEARFSVNDPEESVSALQLVQAQMKKAGINLVLTPTEHTEFSNLRKDGKHQLFIYQTGNFTPEVDGALIPLQTRRDPSNYSGMEEPAFNVIAQKSRAETDPVKRKELVRQAIRFINEGYHAGQFLYVGVGLQFWHPYVKNYHPNGAADDGRSYMPKVEDIWVDK